MFTLSFSKILLTVLVIIVAWRGWRLYQQLQSRLAAANQPPHQRPAGRVQATELVECPRCGTFVPNGTICPSREKCQFRRA